MPKRYNTPHRSHVVKTRLTDEEYADFTERLAPYGISQSEFLRQAIRRTTIRPVLHVSRLKECHIVRYADDFKIFCKSYSDAVKLKHAVEQWLMDRLKLETSPDKSRITNLTKGYSDFLGIKFKLYKKGKKWSIKSHMTDKAINSQQAKLKNAMAQACKSHESEGLYRQLVSWTSC